jgi:hypothetical protein
MKPWSVPGRHAMLGVAKGVPGKKDGTVTRAIGPTGATGESDQHEETACQERMEVTRKASRTRQAIGPAAYPAPSRRSTR